MAEEYIFCKCHTATEENPAGTDCIAHLGEGIGVYKCSFSIDEIKFNARGRMYMSHKGEGLGQCQDFELPEDAKEEIKGVPQDKVIELLKTILTRAKAK